MLVVPGCWPAPGARWPENASGMLHTELRLYFFIRSTWDLFHPNNTPPPSNLDQDIEPNTLTSAPSRAAKFLKIRADWSHFFSFFHRCFCSSRSSCGLARSPPVDLTWETKRFLVASCRVLTNAGLCSKRKRVTELCLVIIGPVSSHNGRLSVHRCRLSMWEHLIWNCLDVSRMFLLSLFILCLGKQMRSGSCLLAKGRRPQRSLRKTLWNISEWYHHIRYHGFSST